ncbi:MAG: toxin, partial [Cyanobacteria bacterium P01_F01_bin.4]
MQAGLWWLPSGRQIFDADHFYLPVQTRDPFNQVYTTTYDDAHLLTVQTEDPLGNQILIDNDYRVLQPFQITDANGNRTQVVFDSLGMVVGQAAIGDNAEGDSLDNFQPDLDEATLQAHIQDPLTNSHEILGSATTRLVYDLWAYYRSQQAGQGSVHPGVVYTLARETHVSALSDGEQSAIQHSFIYSDGFGREIQIKAQAESGLAPERDESGILRCDQNLVYTESRWVGTGRTVFNNKGKPVKQYEPFFSPTHRYESELGLAECGVTPIIFYDPIQRVVATLNPNHTYSKVVLNPWQQTPWDSNDTVLQNPAEDPDVGGYFSALASDEYLPTWHQQRLAGGLGPAEQAAAQKTAAHANTPSVVHLDTLGRPILTLEDNGAFGQHETRMGLDIEGHQLYVIDARGNPVMVNAVVTRDNQGVPLRDDRGNPIVETTAYNLLGHPLYSLSADAGERWTLNNVAGNPLRGWNSRGFVTRLEYDALQRPTHLFV